MKILLFCITFGLLTGCDNLPDLVVERTIMVFPQDFESVPNFMGNESLYYNETADIEYSPSSGLLTFHANADDPMVLKYLDMGPETIFVGHDLLEPTRNLTGGLDRLCFTHKYSMKKAKRLSESKEVDFSLCQSPGLTLLSWTDYAYWVHKMLSFLK